MRLFQFLVCGVFVSVLGANPGQPESVNSVPLLGFGTWNIRNNASDVVNEAIVTGFRHIDCAAIYGNEKAVGEGVARGLKSTGLKRSDLWITSKLWNSEHDSRRIPKALNQTLSDLGLEYLDLYLMHWPVSSVSGDNKIEYEGTWHAMESLVLSGLVRHIGISNFSPHQLRVLLRAVKKIKPYAHQLETHPYLPQESFLKLHRQHNIHVTAYSPLGNTNPTYDLARKGAVGSVVPPLLDTPLLRQISSERGCTPAQVALKWGLERRTSVVPKSAHKGHIRENFESARCQLHRDDLNRIDRELPVKRFNNPSKAWGVDLFDGLQDGSGDTEQDAKDWILWGDATRNGMSALWERMWRLFGEQRDL